MPITYADKPYAEMTPDERFEAYTDWKAKNNAEVAERVRANRAASEALAATYKNDVGKLLDAAWNCPIGVRGNAEAQRYYQAADVAKLSRRSA